MAKIVASEKFTRGARCDNHRTKKPLIRITAYERDITDGAHLCEDCVKEVYEFYKNHIGEETPKEEVKVQEPKQEDVNQGKELTVEEKLGADLVTDNPDLTEEYVAKLEQQPVKEEEPKDGLDEIDALLSEATNGAPQLKEEDKPTVSITKEMVMKETDVEKLKEYAVELGVNLRSMRRVDSIQKALVNKIAGE